MPELEPTVHDLLVQFAVLTGLSAEEVAPLRIHEIDMRRGEVQVQVQVNKTHTSKGYILGSPKTARAVRTVSILNERLFQELGMNLRDHPQRDDREAGLMRRRTGSPENSGRF